jgi:hypothetical protein
VYLIRIYFIGIHLIDGRVSHGHVSYRHASHGRAPHRRVPHGHIPHRRVLYGRVYSRSPTPQTVVDLSRSELQNTNFCASCEWSLLPAAQLLSRYAVLKVREYERKGQMDIVKEAVSRQTQAVEGTAKGDPDLAGRLNNLGIMLPRRFERAGKMEDLEESIRRVQQALNLTPQDHPNLATYLNNPGNSLEMRFERTGTMKDLKNRLNRGERVTGDRSEHTLYAHPVKSPRVRCSCVNSHVESSLPKLNRLLLLHS